MMNSTRPTRARFKPLALALLLFSLCGCGAAKRHEKQVFAMDTIMRLACYGENADEALGAAEDELLRMQGIFDPELDGSPLRELNAAAGARTPVPGELLEAAGTAREIYKVSGGALNPAVYPLVKLWGFIDSEYRLPGAEEIAALLPLPDYGAVELTREGGQSYMRLPAGMEIAFGAVAKGYAADAAIAAMRAAGAESAIISLGGNVQTLGTKPGGELWTVAVENPLDTGGSVGSVSVGETALVTSGSYQRFFEAGGETYHHILDPATGCPARSGLLSVTVCCRSGARADALSTALFVLGERGALDLRRELGDIELVLVTSDGRVVVTGGLRDGFTEADGDWQYEYTD